MKRPTAAQIRAFNEVAATGSFSAAARALGLSQPAITAQVKTLEEGFAVRLFERTAHGSELTTMGHRLFQRTAAQREVERDAAEILLTARALEVGELSIAAGAPGPAMEQVARFRQKYPGIKIDISFGNWQEVVTAVRDRRVDLGILTAAPSGSEIYRAPLLYQSLVALVPQTHPFAKRKSLRLADLAGQSLLFRSGRSQTQRELNLALKSLGLTLTPLFWLESREAVFEAAAQGIGIGFMFDAASRREGGIVRVPISDIAESFPEHVFCLRTKMGTPTVSAFLETAGIAAAVGAP
ncbi:LysR substrate-binding domain-containing protein [Salipiger sp. PrR002]|uniref:LysR substrate-binding domain-containing protein n=1 Tax=Salipiger sp. PrR002 TaxID=2706489 RepID=UPI0013B6A7EF|nr:LysR substrate-binding domain-containing protein [Salipiger sp. PrR002]NDW01902.1 LysR family transcriptional regulator [Salipiger sp. PrR002]NDW59068.1 LysR family transcriptional regulator [Salipiger sp. PrR004]